MCLWLRPSYQRPLRVLLTAILAETPASDFRIQFQYFAVSSPTLHKLLVTHDCTLSCLN